MSISPQKPDNNEVQAARGRLRGALNDTLQNQEVDDIPEDYEEDEGDNEYVVKEQQVVRHRQRGRPKKIQNTGDDIPSGSTSYPTRCKRRKREYLTSSGQKIQAESFVMKLFDRSLDLSKYSEQTSLYPICRAWMANQPRNPSIRSYRDARSPSPTERKENGIEMLAKLYKGEIREVTSMPKPKYTDVQKIPPPTKPPKVFSKTDAVVASNDKLRYGQKEELLAEHLLKWKQVKSDWQKHTRVYQQRSEVNFKILQHLFKS